MSRESVRKASELLGRAEAIIITASNGLSITEGLHLFANDQAFKKLLGDLEQAYGFHNLLQGFFYPWQTPEEKWGFLSRVIDHYSGSYSGSSVMENLKAIVGEKPYFVVTSNAEGHFQLSGFQEERIYEVEMSWLALRCSRKCHQQRYPSLKAIREMARIEKEGRVPYEAIPKCPKCGAVMELYETDPADPMVLRRWQSFLQSICGKKFVVLELGIGSRNQLIKGPMMRLVEQEPSAAYVTINLGDLLIPESIAEKSVGIDGYLEDVLRRLAEERSL